MLHCNVLYHNRERLIVPRETFFINREDSFDREDKLRDLVEEMFDFHPLPIRYSLGTMKPIRSKTKQFYSKKTKIRFTSSPVPASISRNRSTNLRTNFAALALLTNARKGRVVFINNPKATEKIINSN